MFCLPGILLVIATIYLRPQEIFPVLQSVPLLHITLALAIVGIAIDLKLRLSRPLAAPQLVFAILFHVWAVITIVAKVPGGLGVGRLVELFIPFVLFAVIAHGVQSFRALQVLAAMLVTVALFLAYIGVNQHVSPRGCHAVTAASLREGTYDGRPCDREEDCLLNDPEPGAEYVCERVGLLGTNSIGDRVRYRGVLADPNELSLALGAILPFLLAFFERRKNAARLAFTLAGVALIGACVVFTQSRGGQLVVLTVLGVYFVRRFGVRGLVAAAVIALPVLLLGGRSGAEAAGSSDERMECWAVGMQMFRDSPLFGVGRAQFDEYHWLTAHNSYVLATAELGLVGVWLWSMVLYISAKIPFQALRLVAPVARTWSLALLASICGLAVGIFFLSFTYHYVLWIFVGLTGALYAAIRRHDPRFEIGVGMRELAGVLVVDVALIIGLFLWTRGAG